MNSEFEDFDQDFENSEEGLSDFDEGFQKPEGNIGNIEIGISEIEFSPVNMSTAILSKNNLIALLCLKTADKGGAICRVDPREASPAVQLYDDSDKALEWYTKSLNTSKKNGWSIVYDGLPLEG